MSSKFIDNLFNEIGLIAADNVEELEGRLIAAAGEEYAQNVLSAIFAGGGNIGKSFYDLKNSDFRGSLELSSAVDGNIIREISKWIDANTQFFGDTILDVGCDTGLLDIVLSLEFPNAKIVAIDRCKSSIDIARELAAKLGLKNVEFIASDAKDFKGTFDTVLSVRTMHENVVQPETISPYLDFDAGSQTYKTRLSGYASDLAHLANDKGLIVSIERAKLNFIYYAWMLALNQASRVPLIQFYSEIQAQEGNVISTFQAMPFCKHDAENEATIRTFFDTIAKKEAK